MPAARRTPSGARPESLFRPPPERQPLAARMRPRSLDEFAGQEHLVGERGPLRRSVARGHLASLLLWGPPGTGKTSLARLLADAVGAEFRTLSAVMAGVADVRAIIAEAQDRLALEHRRTVLFLDEIHRFNKAQQDALLPHVEDGTIILIGATTENPYFEVITALVSRSRVFQLKPLTDDQVSALLLRALADKTHGYGDKKIEMTDDALAHLVDISGGDARSAMNALELAVESTPAGAEGLIRVDLTVAEEAIQRRAVRYDRAGDEHYDTISAFIKSVRGSDPDAALYWLARMIYAGEDPKFIMRRLLILASEDIGLADPQGIVVASACARALEWCGLPEAQYHLAEAAVYLATAPKSNSLGAYFKALAEVEAEGKIEVPNHLKDASRDAKALGHGKDYKYPHEFPEHWTGQQYLPDSLRDKRFYEPSDQGREREIAEQWRKRRGQGGK